MEPTNHEGRSEQLPLIAASTAIVVAHDAHPHVPVLSQPGTGRKIAYGTGAVVLALIAVFLFGMWSRHRSDKALDLGVLEAVDTPPTVEVMHVRRASPQTLLSLPGEARAFYETTLYARTSGYVSKWLVDIGDKVEQGQILANIETPELDDQLTAANAKVNQQKSEVDLAQAGVNFAKLSFERWESATPDGAVSKQERDQKKSELDTGIARLQAARAQLALAEADAQRLRTLSGFKNVTAPFSGTITQRHVDIGDLVTAGSTSATTPLFSVARSDTIRVFVEVPQSASSQIKVGMSAVVTAAEYADSGFEGKVSRTADSIDPMSRTLRVEVLVPNPEFTLKPGMYVQVAFRTDRRNPPLEIPAGALTLRSSGPQVAVVAVDGTVKFHDIKIALDLGDRIEVASGLSDGEEVALNISSDVSDGQKIIPRLSEDDAPKLVVAPKPVAVTTAPSDLDAAVAHNPVQH